VILLLSLALAATPAAAAAEVLRTETFDVARPSEVVATLHAGCAGCSWAEKGREAAALVLTLDGRYSQHLFLARGEQPAEYQVALGAVDAGTHRLEIALDRKASARRVRGAAVERVEVRVVPEGDAAHDALAFAPVLLARPNTIGRFTDLPILMWYETEPTPRGTRRNYSVIFTNEDGGTPADRLMATWGRVTDIELVYSVERDASGRVLEEVFQGPKHVVTAFAGVHEGRHPLLWVATDNNMVSDRGRTTRRSAPAPIPFDLASASREAVMDANPWTYRVSAEEARREGRIVPAPKPGSRKIADPRRYAYLEACGEVEDAALSFAVEVMTSSGERRWFESDGGLPAFRVQRSGCFQAAVALPPGATGASVSALRIRADTRLPREKEPPLPPGSGAARLTRVNRLFLLGEDFAPGPSLLRWTGGAKLKPGSPPLELRVER
jgi:hypothetical protein